MFYFIHETAIIDKKTMIGKNCKIWHFSRILSGSVIGDGCSFGQNCVVGPNVQMGKNCKVQNNVSVYEGVVCEDEVFLGPSVVFTNVINPRTFINRREEFKTTLLKKGCSIGANATIVCGVTIGEYALIGAGSVVIRDVPPFALVVGNPARQIGWVDKGGVRMKFNEQGVAKDSYDGEEYCLKDGAIEVIRRNL